MVYNATTLIGNLGSDIEVRTLPSGQKVTHVSLAQNRTYVDRNGDTHKDTSWFRLKAWGKQAERMADLLGKGSRVLVEGRLESRSYDKDGATREIVEVVVLNFELIGRAGTLLGGGGASGEDSASEPAEVTEANVPF